MSQIGNKVFNLYINSANRSDTERPYDFTVFFDNEEIIINLNDGVNVNVASMKLPLHDLLSQL